VKAFLNLSMKLSQRTSSVSWIPLSASSLILSSCSSFQASVVLLSATEYPEVLFKGLVSLFTGSVCLGVISCADILVDVQGAV